MRVKIILVTVFIALLTISVISQTNSSFEEIPNLHPSMRVDFISCFYFDKNTSKDVKIMNSAEIDLAKLKNAGCYGKKLNAYSSPVLYRDSATFKDQRLDWIDGRYQPRGLMQNMRVKFNGRSADTLFVTVTINDQPDRQISIRENETALIPAGLLNATDRNSNAMVAFKLKFHDEN